MKTIDEFKEKDLYGREARLLSEWERIDEYCQRSKDVFYTIRKTTPHGLPILYEIEYHVRSFKGVKDPDDKGLKYPEYDDRFLMNIYIPHDYPNINSNLEFRFLLKDINNNAVSHPWHPNIKYDGDFAGRVCLSRDLYGSYTGLATYIERVHEYLTYKEYHAIEVPPFPEDLEVAQWVREQGELEDPGWIKELREYHQKRSNN